MWPTRDFYQDWGRSVKSQVQEAVAVISDGCPAGERLDRTAQPVPQSFQISVPLLEDLLDRGAISPDFRRPPTQETRARLCRPV